MKQFNILLLLVFCLFLLQSNTKGTTITYDFADAENCKVISKDLHIVLSFTKSTQAFLTAPKEYADKIHCYVKNDKVSGLQTFVLEQTKDLEQKTPIILEIPEVSNIEAFLSSKGSLLIKTSESETEMNLYLNLITGGRVHVEKNILSIIDINILGSGDVVIPDSEIKSIHKIAINGEGSATLPASIYGSLSLKHSLSHNGRINFFTKDKIKDSPFTEKMLSFFSNTPSEVVIKERFDTNYAHYIIKPDEISLEKLRQYGKKKIPLKNLESLILPSYDNARHYNYHSTIPLTNLDKLHLFKQLGHTTNSERLFSLSEDLNLFGEQIKHLSFMHIKQEILSAALEDAIFSTLNKSRIKKPEIVSTLIEKIIYKIIFSSTSPEEKTALWKLLTLKIYKYYSKNIFKNLFILAPSSIDEARAEQIFVGKFIVGISLFFPIVCLLSKDLRDEPFFLLCTMGSLSFMLLGILMILIESESKPDFYVAIIKEQLKRFYTTYKHHMPEELVKKITSLFEDLSHFEYTENDLSKTNLESYKEHVELLANFKRELIDEISEFN